MLNWPSKQKLKQLLQTLTPSAIARELGTSASAVTYHCWAEGIDLVDLQRIRKEKKRKQDAQLVAEAFDRSRPKATMCCNAEVATEQLSFEERFWARVDKAGRSADTGCWEWLGGHSHGYGTTTYNGSTTGVHRVAYALLVGPPPADVVLHHTCHHTWCANPAHLTPKSASDHMRDHNVEKTHCINGHELSGANLAVSGGRRVCVVCRREKQRRHRQALRQEVLATRQHWGTAGPIKPTKEGLIMMLQTMPVAQVGIKCGAFAHTVYQWMHEFGITAPPKSHKK